MADRLGTEPYNRTPRQPKSVEEIRERWAKATPGPWRWYGHNDSRSDVYLSTVGRGISIVMGFCRRGMRGAEPYFFDPYPGEESREIEDHTWLTGIQRRARDCWIQEVDYRTDIVDIDQPDGKAIAASWGDVHFLLRRVEELERTVAELRARSE